MELPVTSEDDRRPRRSLVALGDVALGDVALGDVLARAATSEVAWVRERG